jgi:hypothetical protein
VLPPLSIAIRRNCFAVPRSTCTYCPAACAAFDCQTVEPSASNASAASAAGTALAVAPASDTGVSTGLGERSQTNVPIAPPGSVYSKDWSPTATAKLRGSSFSLCTSSAVEPSGLRKADDISCPFHPVVPYDVLAIRTAPVRTNFDRCPIV